MTRVRGSRRTALTMATRWQSLIYWFNIFPSSLWRRHNGRNGVSNHQPHPCLLNRLFRRRSKKTSKPCVTCLCAGNSSVTGEFPAQRASNTENVSICWRHHDDDMYCPQPIKLLKLENVLSCCDGSVTILCRPNAVSLRPVPPWFWCVASRPMEYDTRKRMKIDMTTLVV